jgi:toxin ParE1/3/4
VKIEWLPEAEHNRESQLAYIAERNPAVAISLGDAIEAAVSRLADFPESARTGRVRGTRELVVAGTPYIVVYRIERSAVVVIRMLHGGQDWPPK